MGDNLQRLSNIIHRKLYTLEDENNPRSSKVNNVLPVAVIDDIYENETMSKTLRQLLEDLHYEILTGGLGNIEFPVTSVNGKTGDVVLTAIDLGLGRVDNTADIDKPLSTPQREAILNILTDYDFHVNLQELYDHILDTNNPHRVTIEQINATGLLEEFVKKLIALHNQSREHTTHLDIRRSLATLWELVEKIDNSIDDKVNETLNTANLHYNDEYAHSKLFEKKENKSNKVNNFDDLTNKTSDQYPSTRAVVEFVAKKLVEFNNTLPDIENWIDDIRVVDNRYQLPTATNKYFRKAFFIKIGNSSHPEIAICRKNPDNISYSWDFSQLGSYSKFNEKYFVDSIDGLSIDMIKIVEALLEDGGAFEEVLDKIFNDYYNKEEIDNFNYITDIKIVTGNELGCIRYYINDNQETMSEDIKVEGLQRLAYLEWITEKELWDNSVHSRHILTGAIETRHIQDLAVTPKKISIPYGYLLGNTTNSESNEAHPVTLIQLADALRPLIGGWPDPSVPGGNPYYDAIYDIIPHPHTFTPGIEYHMGDHSYMMRFTGVISSIRNMDAHTDLTFDLTTKDYKLIDTGGSWVYQSDPKEMTVLGGSNITGFTFAMIIMTEEGVALETISVGDRRDAPYDVWIRYTKNAEDGTYNDK